MNALSTLITELRQRLPRPGELQDPTLYDIDEVLQSVLEPGVKLRDIEGASAASLSASDRRLFEALRYFQVVTELYDTILFDGLLSLFYNRTGGEIEALRDELRSFKDPNTHFLNEAHSLLEPFYQFRPDTNFVTSHPGRDPIAELHPRMADRIDAIEQEVERQHPDTFARIRRHYEAAFPNDPQ